MKRSAPTPVQVAVQNEAPGLSFAVIRTALIGMSFVVFLVLGLFFFFQARNQPQETTVAPGTSYTQPLHLAATSPAAAPMR